MDFNRIIQMIINTLLRRAVNGAVDKGIGMARNVGRSPPPARAALTEEEEAEVQRQAALRRARQASKRQS